MTGYIDGVPSHEKLIKEMGEKTIEAINKQNKPPKTSIFKILGVGLWSIILLVIGAYINSRFAEVKQLTIPTTIADRYGNKLHLEEPVAHKGYYEYPILIYDKLNNYRRIDKYAFGKELGIKFDGE